MSLSRDIKATLADLKVRGAIDRGIDEDAVNVKGSTDGMVYILAENAVPKLVLKLDRPQEIGSVEHFLKAYGHIPLLPELRYTDPDRTFMIYTYLEGTTRHSRGHKVNWLSRLTRELLNEYKPEPVADYWGRSEFPCPSWREYNHRSLTEARNNLKDILPAGDHDSMQRLFELLEDEKPEARHHLHGDTGAHNFVFHRSELCGVIDPSPMLGPVLYDFTYAFCSTPDDLNRETLLDAYFLLRGQPAEPSKLFREVVFQLYCRIGICLRHHPQELDSYLQAWAYWKNAIIN